MSQNNPGRKAPIALAVENARMQEQQAQLQAMQQHAAMLEARHSLYIYMVTADALKADVRRDLDLADVVIARAADVPPHVLPEDKLGLVNAARTYVAWEYGTADQPQFMTGENKPAIDTDWSLLNPPPKKH